MKTQPTPGPLMETVWEALRFKLAFHQRQMEKTRTVSAAARESHRQEARKILAALDHLEANR